MLADMETEDGLKRYAIIVITKIIVLAHADLLYHKTKNILFLLCTPMVLIYNRELGIIISSEFFHAKKLQKKHYVLPSIFILFFQQGVVGGYNMKYLGTLGFIFIYRLRLRNPQPNSGTKSTYSMWIILPKPPVAGKSVASFMEQRE